MFFYNSNMAAGYSNTAYLAEALSQLDLMVVVDVQMSETACWPTTCCPIPATSSASSCRSSSVARCRLSRCATRCWRRCIPTRVRWTRSSPSWPRRAAWASTSSSAWTSWPTRSSKPWLSLEALKKTGTAHFPEKEFSYGSTPKWKTPTEKVQFASEACEKAGLSPYPVWVEPAVMPMGDELRLIGGKQAIHSHTQTANIEDLMQITKDYDLTRVWMNADTAARRGIADGDEVEVSNGQHTGRVRAWSLSASTRRRLRHYGHQHTAWVDCARWTTYSQPGYGSACTQETVVNVKKAGA